MPHSNFIEIAIAIWQEIELELSQVLKGSKVKRSIDGSKATIEIATGRYQAIIEIWDQDECLDTTIHRIGAAQGTILSAGSCIGKTELADRLLRLRDELLKR